MNPPPPSDVSLYELAVNAVQPPQLLQLSPTTFKSLVGLFLDFLVEQNLPATLWLKLPRGEVWQAELDRFCQSATAPYSIYSLQTYQKPASGARLAHARREDPPAGDLADPAKQLSPAETVTHPLPSPWDTIEEQDADDPDPNFGLDELELEDRLDVLPSPVASAGTRSKVQDLPLAAESQLKREYFLLAVAPTFYGMVLAHRPRSVRGLSGSLAEGTGAKLASGSDDIDRKHPLLGICCFDQAVLQHVLEDGIHTAISFGQADTASSTNLMELLISWDELQQQHLGEILDPVLMGQFLIKQIQQQENLWRSTAAQRRQVEALPVLQQENEELLTLLRTKNEFIKTMGLELRTPLSTIKTALSLLNSSSLKPPQRQRYMEMLSQQCDRQGSLVSGVLDLVQIESADEQTPMESLRLFEIVPGVVSTYQPLAQEKGVMLGYVVPEDLPPVCCLSPWLKQIVINLLHNSIKFTPKGGQVWVRARQQGESIQIEFRDTGIGIASNDLPRIFDRFYRVRGNGIEDTSGVGLGLSIVQQLLLRCGGSVSVKSKQGEGSVFSVLLPIDAGG